MPATDRRREAAERDMEAYLERCRLEVTAQGALGNACERAKLTRTQLARRVGVTKSRVTKVLDGETNMTLATLGSFGLACGVRFRFQALDALTGRVVRYPRSRALSTPASKKKRKVRDARK